MAQRKSFKTFIIPTKFGLYYLAALFILFLISLTYGHSLAFFSSFYFFSIIIVSAHITNFNLSNIKFENISYNEFSAIIRLSNSSNKKREDIVLNFLKANSEPKSIDKSTSWGIELSDRSPGLYMLPYIKISTTFPFGLFYSWKYVEVNERIYLFPESRKKNSRSLHSNIIQADEGIVKESFEGEEYFGDSEIRHQHFPLRMVNWKSYAKGYVESIKTYADHYQIDHIINFSMLKGNFSQRIEELMSFCNMKFSKGEKVKILYRSKDFIVINKKDLLSCLMFIYNDELEPVWIN